MIMYFEGGGEGEQDRLRRNCFVTRYFSFFSDCLYFQVIVIVRKQFKCAKIFRMHQTVMLELNKTKPNISRLIKKKM